MGMTYAESGVNREEREEAKKTFLGFDATFSHSKYGSPLKTPFNTLYPISDDRYHVKTCDGIGTKVLLSEAAGKHDTIGIDAIAMVVNDCIRTGARPLALTNVIDIKKSDPDILKELQKGLQEGAEQSRCPLVGGETADVPELLSTYYHINCDCVGEVEKKNIITGEHIQPGNVIIGFPSSGVHSNGISLLRRALFRKWGGKFEFTDQPDGLEKDVLSYSLEPTRIYVKDILDAQNAVDILGAVHITGDAYLKFQKLTRFGFVFDNFSPHPIFSLIQEAGKIEDSEMFKTFNMGWGFAIIVPKEQADSALQQVKNAQIIGSVTDSGRVTIKHNNKDIVL